MCEVLLRSTLSAGARRPAAARAPHCEDWLCRQLSEHAVFRTEAFTCTSFYCDTSLPSTSRQQLMQITFTVSFLDVTQKAEGVNEHQPQVIRKLPHNFLYPFG